ncbi:GNAT family N-acetyltransferase [Legionella hackeliae]|uniref:GCN5-related N-acetyltransferase n=1 Tax=Legionella hackeliae TaxID=449 RepID=A0A0A8URI8_LEGHA|nr:GNAT family N-acetyltransferase [Legionella hackeliae]KTD15269.1 N-acetyltransferase GCN5 [Legionella hackeliae]CEK11363.1 GCN5-related N-acetyltransferase [Legionella hackeliae]STX48136.1 N-acetyltransferase GCN5 [Legionella hackeliae]
MAISDVVSQLQILKATLDDYPTIQNMARFYVYDMSRYCGFMNDEWACPSDGLYESYDFKIYFEDAKRQAFLIKVGDELAGFALLNKEGTQLHTDWNMGEFFILAKFQRAGIGSHVAQELWKTYPGVWEISVIPENTSALAFWRRVVSTFTAGHYTEALKTVDYDRHQSKRYILSFDTHRRFSGERKNRDIKITFVDSLSKELEQRMTEGFIAYETSHGIDVNYKRFSVILSNGDTVCGVINAFTAFSEIYVDDIWVDSAYRGKGYGRQLLQALEDQFKGQGFNNINLVTSAFQAPDFYKKCGYTAEFTRINKINPQLSKTFFVKFFEDKQQTQGILFTQHKKD